MLTRSYARYFALATTSARLQFAGAGGGGATNGAGRGGRGQHRFDNERDAAQEDTVEGLFSALKKRFADFELNKDRKLDAEARADEANRKRTTMGLDAEDHDGGAESGGAWAGGREAKDGRPLRICENPNACPRSVLFSPGSKPRAMEKIFELNADCFILDLEDSVGPGAKREARDNIQSFIAKLKERKKLAHKLAPEEAHKLNKRLVVRINSPDFDPTNAMLDLELVGLLGPSIEGVAIPKVTTRTYDLVRDYVHPDHQLWGFFESPLSILQAPEICLSHKYRYAVMGFNDLANELQLPVSATTGDRLVGGKNSFLARDLSEAQQAVARNIARLPLLHSGMQVLLAARTANMFVLDAVFNDPTDAAGFRNDLMTCRAMGFNGKTLIHPSQISPTNTAYTPTAAEVEWASRIKQAIANAHGGVAVVDGKMIEDLHVRQANRTLALYRTSEAEKEEEGKETPSATGSRSEPCADHAKKE